MSDKFFPVIGIHGPAGAGKDTVGLYLTEQYGFGATAFAQVLKKMLRRAGLAEPSRDQKNEPMDRALIGNLGRKRLDNMLGQLGWHRPLPGAEDEFDSLPGFDFNYREAYDGLLSWRDKLLDNETASWRDAAQQLGTEWGRDLDPDIWVKLTDQVIGRSHESDPFKTWLVTDVRFENEVQMVHRNSGFVLHIRGRADNMAEANLAHISEQCVPFNIEKDHAILNDSTFDVLYSRVDELMARLGIDRV